MTRALRPEEQRVWQAITATVRPLGRPRNPRAEQAAALDPPALTAPAPRPAAPGPARIGARDIEPRRKHRIARERDPIGGRIDLHGLGQDRARQALEAFVRRAWDRGARAVLVITGKGVTGAGVLRHAAPEWLAAPHLAHIVAGIAEASRRHGGAGALYVALKRKPRI